MAPNKLVAKIASDFQKPDGLTIVKPDAVLDFLAPLKITDLVGVGKKTEQRLNENKGKKPYVGCACKRPEYDKEQCS